APRADAVAPEAPARADRGVIALIWFDRKCLPRIERKPAWRRLLDALEDAPIDPEVDDPMLSSDPAEIEQRTHVLEILDRGAAIDLEGLHDALRRAAGERGKITPPLALCDGDLVLPFDEVERLKAVVSTATPLAAGDEALGAGLSIARDFLA